MQDKKMTEPIRDASKISMSKRLVLGLQHTFTMFGATVLVPIITGLDISVALFMAGVCTLIFHWITKKKVPVFLGSSFAFIAPIAAVVEMVSKNGGTDALAYARGGIVVAGLIYLVIAGLIYIFGVKKIVDFFPPVVTGPIILVIGLKLAPVAISMSSTNWFLAIVAFITVVVVSVFAKGFLQVVPVIIGLVVGYLVALVTGNVDFTSVASAGWIGLPPFQMAKFDFQSIMIIAPVAIATIVEHIGDVIAIGATVDNDFLEEPGLYRTMFGDGLMTSFSAMFGGPANTTYSENTGVLALTRVWDPLIMRIAALFAIILGIVPKLSSIIGTIPESVVGGISIILFGMIASIGARTLVEEKVDFQRPRNLIVAAIILVLGLGGAILPINLGFVNFTMEGMALAAIVGIILNKILPN